MARSRAIRYANWNFNMKYLKSWVCVECNAIQPNNGEYPQDCWRCGNTRFIRDEIIIPDNANVGTQESML
jgi:ribosomal protein L40E